MRRNAMFGGMVWAALAASSRLGLAHLNTIELLFLLAPLIVVPLGLGICDRISGEAKRPRFIRFALIFQLPAALCVVVSFWIRPSPVAALMVLPWFCFGCALGIVGLRSLILGGYGRLNLAPAALSFLYLSVGCVWLLASRLGVTPMGFQEPIVLLTAVHFHFAGFAAPLLLLAVYSHGNLNRSTARTLFRLIAAGVLSGPGLLAAGFVIGPRMKLAMALLVSLSEIGLSAYFLVTARNLRPRITQVLVLVSAFSVLLAMVLAAIWAIGEFPLQPFVHLDEMARFHGAANGVGFVLCGLIGWSLAENKAAPAQGGSQ